jgi:hypothetical protein
VVWLILTTNAGLAQAFNSDPPADVANAVKQISDAVNLTENCVSYLLSQYVKPTKDEVNDAAAVSKSFATVIESFHSIGGSLESPERYPPDECPELADILSLTSSLRNFAPEQDTDQ